MLRAPPARRTFAEISQRVATNQAANDWRNARIKGAAAPNLFSEAFGIRNFPPELPTTAQKGSSQQLFSQVSSGYSDNRSGSQVTGHRRDVAGEHCKTVVLTAIGSNSCSEAAELRKG